MKIFRFDTPLTGRLPVVLLMTLLALSACATTAPSSGEHPVAERSQARWDALLVQDYETAYSYLSPGYRSGTSLTNFEISMRMRRVQYEAVKYQSSECTDSSCTVNLDLKFKVVAPVPGVDEWKSKSVLTEKWINTEGQWWYLPDKT